MTIKRGDIWLANLNPTRGSEQAGIRPVIVFQNNDLNQFTTTLLTIPLTTNVRRAALPSCVKIPQGEGGLVSDSVALCHQLRVLDRTRLQSRLGTVSHHIIEKIENCVLFTTGII